MSHAHHWIIATDPQNDALPAECACGASRTFPTVKALTIGYGGTMTDNRERQRKMRAGKPAPTTPHTYRRYDGTSVHSTRRSRDHWFALTSDLVHD